MVPLAMAGSGGSEKPGDSCGSPMSVAGAPVPGPSTAASPRLFLELYQEVEYWRIKPESIWDASGVEASALPAMPQWCPKMIS